MYQDLSTRHDWPVTKGIGNLPIRIRENSEGSSSNSLIPLPGAQYEMTALLRRRHLPRLNDVIKTIGDLSFK